jgi:hypothetical protein
LNLRARLTVLSANNKIEGKNTAGTIITGVGYSLSQGATGITILGGEVLDTIPMASVGACANVFVSGVHFRPRSANTVMQMQDTIGLAVIGCHCDLNGASDMLQFFNNGSGALAGPRVIGNSISGNVTDRMIGLFSTSSGSITNSYLSGNVANSTAPASGYVHTTGTVTGTRSISNLPADPTNAAGFANDTTRPHLTFTPGATGWYRILYYAAGELFGRIMIREVNSVTTSDDWDVDFSVTPYDTPAKLNQVAGMVSHYAPPAITQIRAGRNDNLVALDVYVNALPGGPITIYLDGSEIGTHGMNAAMAFLTTPTFSPSTTSWSFTTLTLGAGSPNNPDGYYVNGTKVVGAQGAAIADATDAGSAITQLNLLLARARTHGLIVT